MPFKKIARSLGKILGKRKMSQPSAGMANKVGPGDIDSSQKDKKTGAIRLGAGGLKLSQSGLKKFRGSGIRGSGIRGAIKGPFGRGMFKKIGSAVKQTSAGLKKDEKMEAKPFESGGAVKKASSKGRGMGAATQGGGAVGGAAKKKGYAMGGMAMKKGYAAGGPAMKKGYAMGGAAMKKGYASGGSVRGK